jgi:N-dimethylarginine dimethylaminohydrolase
MEHKRFGAQSMTSRLREVLVKRPGLAFGGAFDDERNGFLHPVELERAQRQHDRLCELLAGLGVTVHELGVDTGGPDLVYTFDPAIVSDDGVIPLRSGKPTRLGEETVIERWATDREIPVAGRIEAPGTVDGGDTFWLRPDLFCIGRSLRTNQIGATQLEGIVGGDVRVFDVPYANGPDECLHLLSVISPIADDMVVVFLPLLPAGLHEVLGDVGVSLIPVPDDEFATLGCNVLAVSPGVVVVADGNPVTRRALAERGCEVHSFEADEVGLNGSGGPTCLTRPILRD